ncbi:MAG: TlpA family protein disulfide reductase [Bdellovibrionales bacterium]|nr:TlpA family protein disulfide reductase [Bdellovibrionales bacterium]
MSPQKTYRLMAGMAIAMLCLLGVAIYSLSRLSSGPWTRKLSAPDIQASAHTGMPTFQLESNGENITPAYFEGKWTLLSFWSYGCPPCLEEMPALNTLALTWSGPEFRVLTVNWDEGEMLDSAKRFLQEHEITLPTIYDPKKILKNAFQVNEFPRHFLIAPDGKIAWQATGAFAWDESHARDQLLKLMELQTPESASDPVE